jgi:hypothetical protein
MSPWRSETSLQTANTLPGGKSGGWTWRLAFRQSGRPLPCDLGLVGLPLEVGASHLHTDEQETGASATGMGPSLLQDSRHNSEGISFSFRILHIPPFGVCPVKMLPLKDESHLLSLCEHCCLVSHAEHWPLGLCRSWSGGF